MRLESGRPTNGITPDLKQWDIAQKGPFTKVQFDGYLDITELNDALITGAETWSEKHALHIINVNYSYKIPRQGHGGSQSNLQTPSGVLQGQHTLLPRQSCKSVFQACNHAEAVEAEGDCCLIFCWLFPNLLGIPAEFDLLTPDGSRGHRKNCSFAMSSGHS